MITKHSCITVALLALTVMSLVAVSGKQVYGQGQQQQNKKPPTAKELVPAVRTVYLRCSVERLSKTEIVLNILNNTTQTIPNGTTINWLITQKVRGSFVLGEDVASGKFLKRSVKPTAPAAEFVFNPQPEPPVPLKVWFEQKVHVQ